MQWVYFLHSGSLLKWLHPADGNTSKSPMTSSNVSKRLLEIHLTVGWKLVKWPMSRWFHRRLASVSPSPRLLRANERLLFYFFLFTPSLLVSPVPFFPLTTPFTQICYCHGEMSHCFQPFQPYFTFLSPGAATSFSPRPPTAYRSLGPLRQSFGCYCQLRHSFQPRFDPAQTPSLNNPHLSSAPRPCCRLLFCHLSVCVSISSGCSRGFAVASANWVLSSGAIREVGEKKWACEIHHD